MFYRQQIGQIFMYQIQQRFGSHEPVPPLAQVFFLGDDTIHVFRGWVYITHGHLGWHPHRQPYLSTKVPFCSYSSYCDSSCVYTRPLAMVPQACEGFFFFFTFCVSLPPLHLSLSPSLPLPPSPPPSLSSSLPPPLSLSQLDTVSVGLFSSSLTLVCDLQLAVRPIH